MSKFVRKINASGKKNVFETPGGQSYLENLRRLHPTELTERAIERAKQEAESPRPKDSPAED